MSLNLKIGTNPVVAAAGLDQANPDPLRSFWIGYTYTVNQGTGVVTISPGYAALYLSHNSKQLPTAQAQLAPFGAVAEPVVIEDMVGNKISLKNLAYVAAEDCEGANQGMQLHLFQFNQGQPGGVGAWIDDSGWATPTLDSDEYTNNNMPFWKRQVTYDANPRYAHFLHRHRNAKGLQAISASMPFGSQSLFGYWLQKNGKVIPSVTYTAAEVDGLTKHYEEIVGQTNFRNGQNPRGLAMIMMGVFGSLLPTDLLRDDWATLMDGNHNFDLCRALARAASEGSRTHSLRQLASHTTDCVVVSQNDSPQEYFCLKLGV